MNLADVRLTTPIAVGPGTIVYVADACAFRVMGCACIAGKTERFAVGLHLSLRGAEECGKQVIATSDPSRRWALGLPT